MPKKEGKKIINGLLKGSGFNFKFMGEYFVNCDVTKYDPVSFLIGNYWIEISPNDFIF